MSHLLPTNTTCAFSHEYVLICVHLNHHVNLKDNWNSHVSFRISKNDKDKIWRRTVWTLLRNNKYFIMAISWKRLTNPGRCWTIPRLWCRTWEWIPLRLDSKRLWLYGTFPGRLCPKRWHLRNNVSSRVEELIESRISQTSSLHRFQDFVFPD